MTIPYRIVTGDGTDTVTAFNLNGDTKDAVYTASQNHPHYEAILSGLRNNESSVFDLFDVAGGMMRRFRSITDRVSWNGTDVLWDGDPVHSVIAEQIGRALDAGETNYEALALFWEDLENNPNEHSKAQAYDWLATHAFQITTEGKVVGYKAVQDDGNGSFRSLASGCASVDGVAYEGQIPNPIGSVVSMPRSEVNHDPSVGCHTGLHVGTWDFAEGFGGNTPMLELHFNARDLVSVPTDSNAAKVRVCKYTVARVVTENNSGGPVLHNNVSEPSWAGDVGYRV